MLTYVLNLASVLDKISHPVLSIKTAVRVLTPLMLPVLNFVGVRSPRLFFPAKTLTLTTGNQGASWVMQQCSEQTKPGTWCCKRPNDSADCCSNSSAVFNANIGRMLLPTTTTTVTVSASASGSAISSASSLAPTAAGCATSSSTSLPVTCAHNTPKQRTMIAGIGISLGLTLLFSWIVLFWRETTRPRANASATVQATPGMATPTLLESRNEPKIAWGFSPGPHELQTITGPAELRS